MKTYKNTLAAVLTALMITGLAACEKDGPAENAGKAIDEAASDIAEEATEAKEAVQKELEKE